MFGTPQQQQQASTGLFSLQPTTAFGAAAKPAGFSGFGTNTATGTSLFGQNKQPTLFGASTSTSGGSLFGGTAAAATTTAGSSLFSANTEVCNPWYCTGPSDSSDNKFRLVVHEQPTMLVLGAGYAPDNTCHNITYHLNILFIGFSQVPTQSGTTFKFSPVTGNDTMLKNGLSTNINTRLQCITTMKQYEGRSLEELRTEDYLANRKGPQAGSTTFSSTSLFGQNTAAASPASFSFGGTQTKPIFGGTATSTPSIFSQPQQPSTALFGQPATTGFGAATSTATGFGGFGTPAKPTLFGQPAVSQPSTGLFSQPAAQTNTAFGTQSFSSGFGATTQSNTLFGAKPAFGATTTTSAFNFGTNTAPSASGTSLFGQKPAGTMFNTGNATAFGNTGTGFVNSVLYCIENMMETEQFLFLINHKILKKNKFVVGDIQNLRLPVSVIHTNIRTCPYTIYIGTCPYTGNIRTPNACNKVKGRFNFNKKKKHNFKISLKNIFIPKSEKCLVPRVSDKRKRATRLLAFDLFYFLRKWSKYNPFSSSQNIYSTDEEGEESLSSSQSSSVFDERASRIGEQSWCEFQSVISVTDVAQSRERSSLSPRSLTEIHTKIVHLSYFALSNKTDQMLTNESLAFCSQNTALLAG
ncbi:Nuclear pore complex protein Nup98-Nup96 [Nymphon striatum]|nr:Nuclear pore complex protein Nup98-Nup96 [Nymphon striatum]